MQKASKWSDQRFAQTLLQPAIPALEIPVDEDIQRRPSPESLHAVPKVSCWCHRCPLDLISTLHEAACVACMGLSLLHLDVTLLHVSQPRCPCLSCMLYTGHPSSEARPHSRLGNGRKIAEGPSAFPQDAAVVGSRESLLIAALIS